MTKETNGYIINLTRKGGDIKVLDMFDILVLPKEETKEVEQFTPLEEVEENPTEQIETVTKQDYDSLVKTVEDLKTLLTANKE